MPMSPDRQAYWRRKLGRLRLGAEPIEDQLARQRRALTTMTLISIGIGLMILGIFASFERPDIGAIVAGLIVVPVIASAWIGYARLHRRASVYQRERM